MNKTTLLSCEQLLDIFSTSHIATAIYTTEALFIEAVTDAMLAFWGKNRDIVGLPLETVVPELAGQPFLEQMRTVLATGETYKGVNMPAVLKIDGEMRTRYYDYEYRAIRNAAGEIYCMLHTAADVTERVLGQEAIEHEQKHLKNLQREQELNEELAAANEELEAMNEELRQTQDQLSIMNDELEERVMQRTAQLEASESRLRDLIKDAPVAISILSGRDFVIESANQAILRIWGKNEQVIGKTLLQALPELEGQPFIPQLENTFDSGESFVGREISGIMEYANELKEIFINFVYKPLKNEHGHITGIMVVANEVTEQVLARKAVEAVKFRLESMVSTTPVAMTILRTRNLIIEQANQAMLNIWQRNNAQTVDKRLVDVFPELIGQPFPDLLANVFDTGKSVAFPELPVNIGLPDGTSKDIYVNFSYDPIFDLDGNVESILASVTDVTDAVENRKMLEKSRFDLQEAAEELANTNEELAATNEEMMAANEELAATNEELVSTQDHLHDVIQQLSDSKDRFSFLLNSIPQQVWTARPDGALDYVNNVVCKDFGYPMSDIIEHGWRKFIHPDDLPKALKLWKYALENHNEYFVEFRLLFADSTYQWHMSRAVPLIENGLVKLWIGTNTNIELQKSNEQKKDEFLSIASHELKTPLTSIKAFNQLMQRGGKPETVPTFLQKSSSHIQRLEKLISDLLDVTRLNAGKLEYTMQPFSFSQLLTESADNIQQLSPAHKIELENAIDIIITGDQFRLEQVMTNFLSNAVKYSPNGDKVIINSVLDQGKVIVSVQDFGIGISAPHISKLFDRYYRVDNTAMRFEGLGLGLFISSEIIKRHNGTIWIESELGKGSTFYFSLPVISE
ncbi:MAG: PAS domain S-box protein [Sphingobacteriaceae bacterium]|nr:MAG: PAS domain S-box protein [Sphingobacteriaceae bacterium]